MRAGKRCYRDLLTAIFTCCSAAIRMCCESRMETLFTGFSGRCATSLGSTGLSEDAEAELRKHLPSHAAGQVERGVQWNMSQAVKAGITTIVDPQSYLEDLEIFQRLREEGKLPARLQVALFHRRGTSEATLQKFDEARRKYNDDWLRVAADKMYIDDVVEPHTAGVLGHDP